MTTQSGSRLKWGFSSMGAPDLSFPELVKLAARQKCPHLELRTLENTIEVPSVLDSRYPDPAKARNVADAEGVRVIVMKSSFSLTDAGDPERAALENFVRWADHLDAPFIRVFGGGKWEEPVTDAKWERAAKNLSWWTKSKREKGWKADVLIETHDAFSGSKECLDLFERTGTNLPILWDTHHTWKLAGENPRETWEKIGEHVRHVHIKDSISQPSGRHPYTYVPIGEGEFPWQEIIAILTEANYQGVVSIEWEKLWHPYLEPLESALEKARKTGLW